MSENEEEYCLRTGRWLRSDGEWQQDIPDWVGEQLELVWQRMAGCHSDGEATVWFKDGALQFIRVHRR